MKKNEQIVVNVSSLIFFILMLFINYAKQTEISAVAEINKPLIQPSGYTFSIWFLIYVWLFIVLVYSFFKSAPSIYVDDSMQYLLPLNFTFNALWVLAFVSKQYVLSCLLICLVLTTTALIYMKLKKSPSLPWLMTGVFSIYLGWITVATTVNIFWVVNNITPTPWSFEEQLTYSILVLIIIVLLAIYLLVRYKDKLALLTIVWSLIGIALNGLNDTLSLFCFGSASLLLILLIIFSFRK